MSNTPPWASQQFYPVLGQSWDGILIKVDPGYAYFTPGQTPTAPELNAMFNKRDIALNAMGSLGAEIAAANFGQFVQLGNDGSGHLYSAYAVCFDQTFQQWLACVDSSTPSPAIFASQDGKAWAVCPTIAAFGNTAIKPRAIAAYPGTGTVVTYGETGVVTSITRCVQSSAPTTVATTNNAWAIRAGALCNQGVMAYFWGAATPGMYFIGASSNGVRAAWLGFCATDSNDGSGTAGVWTDAHTSLPAAFLSGNSLIYKWEAAQSDTALVVAQCGQLAGTDPSFLMKVDVNGVMTDVTPASIGSSRAIRGVAYSATDALWGILSHDAGGDIYFDVSPDLVTWTNVLTSSGYFANGLAVIRNTWVMALSTTTTSQPDKAIYMSNVAAVLTGATPLLGFSTWPAFANASQATIPLTLQSNEVPPVANSAFYPKATQLMAAFVNTNASGFSATFWQSLRAGHNDGQQSGVPAQVLVPGYNTVLDLDFSTLASGNVTGDGAHTIGPYSWTKSRSANDRAVLANVNGAGMRWQPTGGKIGSALFLPFSSFVPSSALLWSTSFRVWLYIQGQNLGTAGDSFFAAITPSATATALSIAGITEIAGPLPAVYGHASGGSAQTIALGSGIFDENNVVVLDVPSLRENRLAVLSGELDPGVANVWPAEAGALYSALTVDGGTTIWQDPSPAGAPFSVASLGIALYPVAAGAALTVTVGRVRVDVRL